MIDELLFQRGHILTRIGDEIDDYDVIITDHYFAQVLSLDGEVVDANGSEYEVISLNGNDFEIVFIVHDTEFQADGSTWEFEELIVKCTGAVISEDDCDVLRIDTYDVVAVS